MHGSMYDHATITKLHTMGLEASEIVVHACFVSNYQFACVCTLGLLAARAIRPEAERDENAMRHLGLTVCWSCLR